MFIHFFLYQVNMSTDIPLCVETNKDLCISIDIYYCIEILYISYREKTFLCGSRTIVFNEYLIHVIQKLDINTEMAINRLIYLQHHSSGI